VADDPTALQGINVAGRDVVIREQHVYLPAPAPRYEFQLPPAIPDFVGRTRLVNKLVALLRKSANRVGGPPLVLAIAGQAGVGKTACAVRIAHRARRSFPFAQLYANLRGVEAQRADPFTVLGDFLQSLGVDGSALPKTLDGRSAMYRARLGGQRALVLLDNAADEAQVRPLLPGAAPSTVVVTSRSRLTSMEWARVFALDILNDDESITMLMQICGNVRAEGEIDSISRLVTLCGGLPLAIRISGARLAARPHMTISRLVQSMEREQDRLAVLRQGDLEVRASLALSYDGQSDCARRLFRLLGLVQAVDLTVEVAGALAEMRRSEAEEVVESLAEAHLIEIAGEGSDGRVRYRFHDLLRVFARERLGLEDSDEAQVAALERMIGLLLATARDANAAMEPGALPRTGPNAAKLWVDPDFRPTFHDSRQAIAWFTAERESLVTAVVQAEATGLCEHCWELADALPDFLELRGRWFDWRVTHEAGLRAARQAGNQHGIACMLRDLAEVYRFLGHSAEGQSCLEEAVRLYAGLGDRRNQADALRGNAIALRNANRIREAKTCLDRSLALFLEVNEPRGEAYTLVALADLYREGDALGEASAALARAVEVFEDLGYQLWRGTALCSLGDVQRRQGDYEAASATLLSAVELFRAWEDRQWLSYALLGLGEVYRDRDLLDEAFSAFAEAHQLAHELGEVQMRARLLTQIGLLHRRCGRPADAQACWSEALDALRWLNSPDTAEVEQLLAGTP